VVLARETRSTPADAHKLAPNLGNIPISELPRLSMQGSGIKCLYIKLKNLQTGKKRTVLTFHRANSSRKYGCGFIQTDRSFEREPASVGVCCALRVGLGRLDFVTVSIIARCKNRIISDSVPDIHPDKPYAANLPDHLEAGRDALQHFGDIFSQLVQLSAAVRAGLFRRQESLHFPWQMRRQRLTPRTSIGGIPRLYGGILSKLVRR
jgi:hypothetical protein